MIIGWKMLRGDSSLNRKCQYPVGKWIDVPGNGAYVAVTNGLLCGGRGDTIVAMECEEPTGASAPDGVICYQRVRRLPDLHQDKMPPEILVAAGFPLPSGLSQVGGDLDLRGYAHPLPSGLTQVGGSLDLRGYAHPLPSGLTQVGGFLDLEGYAHPLPSGLTQVGGDLDLRGYAHPLPSGLKAGRIVR